MSQKPYLSVPEKLTVAALVAAAVGIAIQIAAGAPYPAIPPGFFMLLLPALAIAVARTWWAAALAVIGGLFLLVGVFAADQTHRLIGATSPMDAIGLWIQTLAVAVAVVTGSIAARAHYQRQGSVING